VTRIPIDPVSRWLSVAKIRTVRDLDVEDESRIKQWGAVAVGVCALPAIVEAGLDVAVPLSGLAFFVGIALGIVALGVAHRAQSTVCAECWDGPETDRRDLVPSRWDHCPSCGAALDDEVPVSLLREHFPDDVVRDAVGDVEWSVATASSPEVVDEWVREDGSIDSVKELERAIASDLDDVEDEQDESRDRSLATDGGRP
jgi:hypothetical protein